MVYKAIERATGEIVAIKHVSVMLGVVMSLVIDQPDADRSTLNLAKTIFRRYNRRSRC